MSEDKSVLTRIAALNRMDFKGLKEQYIMLIGREPPSRTRKQVVARLAYRIQEIAYGGLSAESMVRLQAIYESHGSMGNDGRDRKKRKSLPANGTKLTREYMGQTYEVIVKEKGFEYQGVTYRSLSAIARKITGSHISGPAFFGLPGKGGGK